jgi:hypothetical protein
LYARNPDTNLAMPLKDVKKSQIANTWARRAAKAARMKARIFSRPKARRSFSDDGLCSEDW